MIADDIQHEDEFSKLPRKLAKLSELYNPSAPQLMGGDIPPISLSTTTSKPLELSTIELMEQKVQDAPKAPLVMSEEAKQAFLAGGAVAKGARRQHLTDAEVAALNEQARMARLMAEQRMSLLEFGQQAAIGVDPAQPGSDRTVVAVRDTSAELYRGWMLHNDDGTATLLMDSKLPASDEALHLMIKRAREEIERVQPVGSQEAPKAGMDGWHKPGVGGLIKGRRLGRFTLPQTHVRDIDRHSHIMAENTERAAAQAILADVLVLRTEENYLEGTVTFWGMCEHFDRLPEGEMAPEYVAQVFYGLIRWNRES